MISRLHVSTFLALTVVAWGVLLWLRGIPITWNHLWPFGLVVTFLTGIAALFERWLWKLPILHGWFIKRPEISGTWCVELKSEWTNPQTGKKSKPTVCYMAIRQTLSTLSMRLFTPESSSLLIAHSITLSNDGIYQIAGVYTNKPQLSLRGKRSEIHYGTLLLDVHGNPPTLLEGHYWTDRNSSGSMTLTGRKKEVFSTYREAHKAFKQR